MKEKVIYYGGERYSFIQSALAPTYFKVIGSQMDNLTDKKSFILYTDIRHFVDNMSDEQAGVFIKAVFSYACDGGVSGISDPMTMSVFSFVKDKIDHASDKYLKRCEKNRENARKRWGAKESEDMQPHANVCEAMPNDNDTVSDNDTDNNIISSPTKSVKEDAFVAFYSKYPRKVGKQLALKSWMKLSQENMQKAIDAVESECFQKHMASQKKAQGDFRPHPSSWLNAGGWDDEYEVERSIFDTSEGDPF